MKLHQLLNSTARINFAPDGVEGGDAGAAAAAAAAGGAKPWYEGADAELIGHIQTKGWHDKPANVAALEAVRAHREAEKFVGVPADRVLKLPTDAADEAGWKAVHAKLGVPEKVEGYDFSTLKDDKGTPLLDATRSASIAAMAHKLNIPAATAVQLASELLKSEGSAAATAAADKTAALAEEHKVLDANWGQNKEANTFLARKGAEKLGLTPQHVDALEGVVGYAKIMEALRQVGDLAGESRFVGNGGGFNGGIMTREQAVSRKAELMKDTAWSEKYLAGDATAGREMMALNTLIVGDDTAASRQA